MDVVNPEALALLALDLEQMLDALVVQDPLGIPERANPPALDTAAAISAKPT